MAITIGPMAKKSMHVKINFNINKNDNLKHRKVSIQFYVQQYSSGKIKQS